MVNMHHYPGALIEAIRKSENFSGLIHLEKGSSKRLYVISFEENGKKILNVVTYGEVSIKNYLLYAYSKSVEEMDYTDKDAKKKLILFIKKIFCYYKTKTILIDGEELTLDKTLYDAIKEGKLDEDKEDKEDKAVELAFIDYIDENLEELTKNIFAKP